MTDEIRCPMCGKTNPAEEPICKHCGARLSPMGDIKNEDLFSESQHGDTDEFINSLFSEDDNQLKDENGDIEDEILNWLDQDEKAPEDAQVDDSGLTSSDQDKNAASPLDENAISDWLGELPAEDETEKAKKDTDAWLKEILGEDEPAEQEAENLFSPDLKDVSVSEPTAEESITPEDEVDMPDWFTKPLAEIDLTEESTAESQPEEIESKLVQPEEQPEKTQTSDPFEAPHEAEAPVHKEDEIPEWFAAILSEDEDQEDFAPPEELVKPIPLPSDKEDIEKVTWDNYISDEEEEEADLPEWFANVDESQASSEETSADDDIDSTLTAAQSSEDIPVENHQKGKKPWSWLLGRKDNKKQNQSEQPESTPDPLEPTGEIEEPVNEVKDFFDIPKSTDAIESTAALPDWMLAEEGESAAEEPTEVSEPTGAIESTAALPTWMMEEQSSKADDEIKDFFEEPGSPIESTAALPDWMMADDSEEKTPEELEESGGIELPAEPIESTAALPDWMMADDSEEETPEKLEESGEIELPAAPIESTAALPDWMMADDSEEKTPEELEESGEIELPAEPIESTAALPDWMMADDSEEEPPEELEESGEIELPAEPIESTAALPDWMMADDSEEEPLEELEESPEEQALFDSTASLPDWITEESQEEEPLSKESGELFEMLDSTAPVDNTAGLPDWLASSEEEEEQLLPENQDLFEELDESETSQPELPTEGTSDLPDWLTPSSEQSPDLVEKADTSADSDDEPDEFAPKSSDTLAWLLEDTQGEDSDVDEEALFEDTFFETLHATPFDEESVPEEASELETIPEEAEEIAETEDFLTSIEPLPLEDTEDDALDWITEDDFSGTDQLMDELPLEQTGELLSESTIELPEEITLEDLTSEIEPLDSARTPGETAGLPEWLGLEGEETESTDQEPIQFDETFIEFDSSDDFTLDFSQDEEASPETEAFEPIEKLDEELEQAPSEELYSTFEQEPIESITEEFESIDWITEESYEDDAQPSGLNEQDELEIDAIAEELEQFDELPLWVTEQNVASSIEGQLEQTGPLKGLRGLLASDTGFLHHQRPPIYTGEITFTDEESRRVKMMEEILSTEKETRSRLKAKRRDYNRVLRLVLTALFIAAIFVGLFTPANLSESMIANPPTQVVQFYQLLNNDLVNTPERPVLVVIDSQAAQTSELRAYAELPLKSLMESDARILLFSTKPEGALLARTMFEQVIVDYQLDYDLDQNTINLGTLPGGSTGLRSFALDMRNSTYGLDVGVSDTYVWDRPEIMDIDSIDDFSSIILIADSLENTQSWIEQVGILLPETTHLFVISSAQTAPLLKAYLNSGQIDGLIGNILDATAYATLDNQINDAVLYWNAHRMTIILMIIVILGGGAYYGLTSFTTITPKPPKSNQKKAGKK